MKTKNKIIVLIFMLAVLLIGCERKINLETLNCKDCYQEPSDYGPLTLFFTINEENPYVPFIIYVGDFYKRVVEYADTAFFPEIEIDLPVVAFYCLSFRRNVRRNLPIETDFSLCSK